MLLLPLASTLFPYTTLFRSVAERAVHLDGAVGDAPEHVRHVVLGDRDLLPEGQRVLDQIGGVEHHQLRRVRSEEHTSELQSLTNLVCRLLLEKKKNKI